MLLNFQVYNLETLCGRLFNKPSKSLFKLFYFAENLLLYPAKHVVYADHLPQKWDEELMKKILSYFVTNNMRVEVVSDAFEWEREGMLFFYACTLINE